MTAKGSVVSPRWPVRSYLPGLALVGVIGLIIVVISAPPPPASEILRVGEGKKGPPALRLPAPGQLRPLTPLDAALANERRPFSKLVDSPASEFTLRADPSNRGKAIDCLTQAVYYEAASEGIAGQRAVAQVVLNRMRHPAYPSTICGVVYQGAERSTGCQFTFTCDGSLARVPQRNLWLQAGEIAREALSGQVFAAVGHSTHYHADYVVPYWADSLVKSVKIGHHIFYRLPGALGSRTAFRQNYAGFEPDLRRSPDEGGSAIQIPYEDLIDDVAPLSDDEHRLGKVLDPTPKKAAVVADQNIGKLIADQNLQPGEARTQKFAKGACSKGGREQSPLLADGVQTSVMGDGC